MAENDAEKAFLEAQTMNADSEGNGETDKEQGAISSNDYDYDPSKTLQDEYSASLTDSKQSENISSNDPSPSDFNPPQQTSSPSEMAPNQPAGDAATAQAPLPSESQTPASAPQPKAKTIGGFVVDDEDEDGDEDEDKGGDDDYEPPGLLGVEGDLDTTVNIPQQSVSGNTNQSTSTPDVSLQGIAQESANAQNVPNSSYLSSASAPDSFNEAPTVPDHNLYANQSVQPDSAQPSAAPTPTPESPSAPKGRLPHDRVGILEDRIQEDPRGDIPAWLDLINEHKARSRIDNTREVYERFLKVFPSAVRMALV